MPRKGFMVRDAALLEAVDGLVRQVRAARPDLDTTRESVVKALLRAASRDRALVKRALGVRAA